MSFSGAYRSLLKPLKKLCDTRPHFAQDLRFLITNDILLSSIPSHFTKSQRSARECCWIDSRDLFLACKNDLRFAIDRNIEGFSETQLPSIVAQIQYRNELNWLRDRLNKALSDGTGESIRQLLKISQGPTKDDFIPDSFFSEATSSTSADVLHDDKSRITTKSPLPSVKGACVLPDGDDVLYSAGAIGCQRELVVLSREEKGFPLAHSFLGRSIVGGDNFDMRYTQKNCMAQLLETIKNTLSTSSQNEFENFSVTLQLAPFDPLYGDKSESGFGTFCASHRLFYSTVSLLSNASKKVEIVNAHFYMINLLTKELSEKIGYISPTSIFRLIREQIKESGEKKLASCDGNSTDEEKSNTSSKDVFSDNLQVLLSSASDGPIIVKGMLYFREVEEGHSQFHPIKVAMFGPALIDI